MVEIYENSSFCLFLGGIYASERQKFSRKTSKHCKALKSIHINKVLSPLRKDLYLGFRKNKTLHRRQSFRMVNFHLIADEAVS